MHTTDPRSRVDAGATLGIEEEFLLVDPRTAEPVDCGPAVIDQCHGYGPWTPQYEYARSQVEVATGVCHTAAAAAAQLTDARARLAERARAHGALLIATGAPIVASRPITLTSGDRYARIATHYGGMFSDYQCCGLHVHVGVPDRDAAAALLNYVTPWLPTLLALSANSPLRQGRDADYASLRALAQAAFPAAGPPPWVESAADHDRHIARLVDCGAFTDDRITFWLARLSPHLPTIEIRVADSVPTPADAMLLAALCRAIVVTAASDLAAGIPAPRPDRDTMAAALWSAARHGMRGAAVDPVTRRRTSARRRLAALLNWVRPALAEFGELSMVTSTLAELSRRGTGAELQRVAAPGGPAAVAAMLAAQTTGLTPVEAGYTPV
ncbi:carboxylate-amine ligase [Actinokineospora fastidiosa]|uniref:Putative glutamate--cysteine ligase 2 n=1 Tax=Actinokineospora fastidiosa TaxID=1816 RepID=A0A918LHH9_9PSEU|nr:glutamate--cysteine ligase [Actinokineospora fastidiosa]GGS47351.1 putative glutamate--cysteine ligase 2 [Actinokineospora fastidiosa]